MINGNAIIMLISILLATTLGVYFAGVDFGTAMTIVAIPAISLLAFLLMDYNSWSDNKAKKKVLSSPQEPKNSLLDHWQDVKDIILASSEQEKWTKLSELLNKLGTHNANIPDLVFLMEQIELGAYEHCPYLDEATIKEEILYITNRKTDNTLFIRDIVRLRTLKPMVFYVKAVDCNTDKGTENQNGTESDKRSEDIESKESEQSESDKEPDEDLDKLLGDFSSSCRP